MEYTQNYHLPTWAEEDRIQRVDFNGDNAKIDGALGALAGEMRRMGNCRIWATTYVGNGGHGSGQRNSVTFPGRPLLVMGADPVDGYVFWAGQGMHQTYTLTSSGGLLELNWSGNTLQWYHYNTNIGQLNHPGRTYYVFALLDAAE